MIQAAWDAVKFAAAVAAATAKFMADVAIIVATPNKEWHSVVTAQSCLTCIGLDGTSVVWAKPFEFWTRKYQMIWFPPAHRGCDCYWTVDASNLAERIADATTAFTMSMTEASIGLAIDVVTPDVPFVPFI